VQHEEIKSTDFMHKHRIKIKNFDLENGKISFSKLAELQETLTALAEGAVLNLIEGRSKQRNRSGFFVDLINPYIL